jgi:signal transduction histidine kinase
LPSRCHGGHARALLGHGRGNVRLGGRRRRSRDNLHLLDVHTRARSVVRVAARIVGGRRLGRSGRPRRRRGGATVGVLASIGLFAGVNVLTGIGSRPGTAASSRLPAVVEATGYFVVAEALTNVAKHARATRAEVKARVRDGTLLVRVR